jgi:putative DNA primase/helicase
MSVADVLNAVQTARPVLAMTEAPTASGTPLAAQPGGGPAGFGSKARSLEYLITPALDDRDESFDDELVEGVLGRTTMAVIYGDSNCGKTFLAIELAARVNLADDWLGHHSVGGIVLYLATEAATSVRLRFKAWMRVHGRVPPSVVIVQSPVNLFDNQADMQAVIALVAKVELQFQQRVVLIIGDTLARMSAGANENAGEDMGVVIGNADRIRAATEATFLWIHHSGKNAAMGMRGWSGMRAFIDTEIEVTADESTGLRTAEITKQRDLSGKGMRLGFRLQPVPLGLNRWGNERASCVVESADAPVKMARGKRQSEVARAIVEFLSTRGTGCTRVRLTKHFEGRYVRQSVYREISKMVECGMLIQTGPVVALPGAANATP